MENDEVPRAGPGRAPNLEVWVLWATILASSMAFIDGTALNVALPLIQFELRAGASELLWIVNGYLIMLAALILVGGALGDAFGRKRIFMIGISVFAAGSALCGFSPSASFLVVARIVQGLGGALMIPGSLSIINSLVAPERRGRAIGTWSAATTLVTILGPLLGGLLSDAGLWRLVFWINIPLGLVSLIILVFRVPESKGEKRAGKRIDVPGTILVAGGLAALAWGFLAAPDQGFGGPGVIAALTLGACALIAFGIVEFKSKNPMMPPFLFSSPTFSGANLLTLFLYGALAAATLFLPLNLVQIQGYTKTEAGLSLLPFSILLILMSRWSGGLVDRIGARIPLVVGPGLVAVGFACLAIPGVGGGPGHYWTEFLPGIILFGLGMGFTVAPLTSSVMGAVAREYSGTASGINNAVSRIGGVLAIATLGACALFVFSDHLLCRSSGIGLSPADIDALRANASRLGATKAPEGLDASQVATITVAVRTSFVDAYRVVMIVCAGLAALSAISAGILIGRKSKSTEKPKAELS